MKEKSIYDILKLMDTNEIQNLINLQKSFFESGKTLPLNFRRDALTRLYNSIMNNYNALEEALKRDLGKNSFESSMCEIRLTLSEITYMKKHIVKFAKVKRVHTPLAHFLSTSKIVHSPYGTVLIMSPWNYPVLLTLEPLVDALSAGNTAIIKPSAYAPYSSNVIKKVIEDAFLKEYVAVIEGGRDENKALLESKFDYIFFTGSKAVGKEVMKCASENLTPVTLELGGKSPVVVLSDANIKLSARRIVFGKYLNCGQTCVAPDYILVDKKIKDSFIDEVKKEIVRQFGANAIEINNDYGKIINKKHFDRLVNLIDKNKVVYGGTYNKDTLKIEPTIMNEVTFSDSIMQEEIFGPIMPIIGIDSKDEAMEIIKKTEHPLAFYIFTSNKRVANDFIHKLGFGGGCINDTIVHLATSSMGFGGYGESGMGAYHGRVGFETFSHRKSILDKKTILDLPIRYQGYTDTKRRLINMFLK